MHRLFIDRLRSLISYVGRFSLDRAVSDIFVGDFIDCFLIRLLFLWCSGLAFDRMFCRTHHVHALNIGVHGIPVIIFEIRIAFHNAVLPAFDLYRAYRYPVRSRPVMASLPPGKGWSPDKEEHG